MDSDTEFPLLSKRELDAITHYLNIEKEFMAPRTFYSLSSNTKIRVHAVSTIAKICDTEDSYIPYVAVNYFDRFVSTNSLSELQGSSILDKVRLVAICCYTLSSKMRTKNFFQKQFLTRKEAVYKTEFIMRMEFRILSGLDWRMRSITPFLFLDHYYPTFKRIGGFKRQCINEIIVHSQGEVYFAQFKPSELALSAFLAATYLGYPLKFTSIEDSIRMTADNKDCYLAMVHLCRNRKINIHSSSGELLFSNIPSSLVESSGSESDTTKSEEGLGEAGELHVQTQGESSTTQVEAQKEGETGSGGKCEEMVGAESREREDKGKAVDEICEAEGASENELRERQRKGKAVMEIREEEGERGKAVLKIGGVVKESEKGLRGRKRMEEALRKTAMSENVAEGEPLRAMNFKLQWPVVVVAGERVENVDPNLHVDESRMSSTRGPTTTRGSNSDLPANRCLCTII